MNWRWVDVGSVNLIGYIVEIVDKLINTPGGKVALMNTPGGKEDLQD